MSTERFLVLFLVLCAVSAEFGHVKTFRFVPLNLINITEFYSELTLITLVLLQRYFVQTPFVEISGAGLLDERLKSNIAIYVTLWEEFMTVLFGTLEVKKVAPAVWLAGSFNFIRMQIRFLFGEFDYGNWHLDVVYWTKIVSVHSAIFDAKGYQYFIRNRPCIRDRVGQYFLPLYHGKDTSNCSEIDPIIISKSERPIDPELSYGSLVLKILLLCSILGAILIVRKLILKEWKTYKSLRFSKPERSVEIMDKSSWKSESSRAEKSTYSDKLNLQGTFNRV
ncbi:unnamed protein product [Moneuplotes crassus]|uniref:Uncharacterized protein n=1 Tax=Euplotes crassus TaxID=5936 RepID=A0AAD2D1X5_EUPCR|nr:unnamed protein product [Moneuplotes crassus]